MMPTYKEWSQHTASSRQPLQDLPQPQRAAFLKSCPQQSTPSTWADTKAILPSAFPVRLDEILLSLHWSSISSSAQSCSFSFPLIAPAPQWISCTPKLQSQSMFLEISNCSNVSCVCTCTHVCSHVCTCTHIYTYTNIYVHMYTHT